MESVDYGDLKLLFVKVGGLKKKSVTLAFTAEVCTSTFDPGSTLPRIKPFSNFDGQ